MKKTMKKLIALMLIMILVLPQVIAAEETTPSAMTITEEVTINEDAAKSLLPMFGVDEKLAESVSSVLNAMSSKLVIADNGAQMDFDLNGENVASIGGEMTEDGVTVASTLFPNYVVKASMESILGLLQTVSPGEGEMAGMAAASEKLSTYIAQFITACSQAAVPGEAEEADFTFEGVTFNTKVPVKLDVDAIVAAEGELVEQILTDEDIRPLLDMSAQYSGGSFDPDSIRELSKEIFSDEYMPNVEVNVYVDRDEEGSESDIFCAVSEATYKGEEEPSYRYTYLFEGTAGKMKFEIPEAKITISSSYKMEESGMNIHTDCDVDGQYFGFNADVALGEDIVTTVDLFFSDPENPLIRDVVTVSMDGERNLKTDAEQTLTLDEIMENEEALYGLFSDIMENGLANLTTAATKVMPEVGELINSFMGETQEKRVLQLGTSVYTIEIPASFVEGERTEEEIEEDMVAYLYSPDTTLDFDVYQFSKEGYPEVLADYAKLEAEEYKGSEIVTDGNINGIDAAWYRAEETYDGQEYETLTYILDGGDEYVEVVFWLDDDNTQAEADQIMNSLTFVER